MPIIKSRKYDDELQEELSSISECCEENNIKLQVKIITGFFKDKILISMCVPNWAEYGIGNKYTDFTSIEGANIFLAGYDRGYYNGRDKE